MTDSEILARWQGKCYHVSDWGQTICKYCGRTNDPRYFDFDSINPDYLNDDAAAMSLLDTLVEKGYDVRLQSFVTDPLEERWQVTIWDVGLNTFNGIVDVFKETPASAITSAILQLIESEEV